MIIHVHVETRGQCLVSSLILSHFTLPRQVLIPQPDQSAWLSRLRDLFVFAFPALGLHGCCSGTDGILIIIASVKTWVLE